MDQESQTHRVTQIQVRVDCNGCMQKIKKALNGIKGIHNLHVDFRRQKLTIIGVADPEKIVKAIKKTKKNAIISSNIGLTSPSQVTEPKGIAPAPDAIQPPPEATPSPKPTENNANQQWSSTPRRKHGEVHVIHPHLPNYVNRFSSGHSWGTCHNSQVFLQQPPQQVYVTHSYNTYMSSPYVTEYEYVRSPPSYSHYHLTEHCGGDYPNGNVSITSMFSDDNPNACCIV